MIYVIFEANYNEKIIFNVIIGFSGICIWIIKAN